VGELVVRVRNEVLDGLDNLIPFERLVRELNPKTIPGANPIYQSIVIFEPPMDSPDPAWSIHLMETEIGDAVASTRLDLELQLDERPDGHIAGRLIFDRDLFEHASASRIVGHFVSIAVAMAGDAAAGVSTLDLLDEDERRRLVEWNATITRRSPATVHGLVERHADRQPDAPAISAGGRVTTYSELCRSADRTAQRLRAAGLGAGDVVACCSEPSSDLVAAVLGVLKAGASYLLLDPALARQELDHMVADSGAATIYATPPLASLLSGSTPILALADPGGAARLPDDPGEETEGDLCCLQYSGTGDEGRGVSMSHEGVINVATALGAELGLGSSSTTLVLPSTLFGASAVELWMPLIAGAKLVLAPSETVGDGARVSALIAAERVSFLHAAPDIWRTLIDTGLRASRGLSALCGGGALDTRLAGQLLDRYRAVFTAYGAPETTVYSTLGRVERDRRLSIGYPIANTRVYILDDRGRQVPIGMGGQLVIAGRGVARLADGEQDGAGFVDDPLGSGRAYATGDVARWRPEGSLELVHPRP
jgi:non-ribosomal peptide synthetase component F